MSELLAAVGGATLLLAAGLWLTLPRLGAQWRGLGTVLIAVSLGLLAWQLPGLGSWAADSVFYLLAAVTVISAVATVTFRSPVYAAIWFALSLLGTAGLFLFVGAQFLGVATIVVYAGAILVTFLFVLMLANPSGQAPYDRISWAPLLASVTGAAMVGVLTLSVLSVFDASGAADRGPAGQPVETAALEGEILADQHVAHLGAWLFSKQLVAIEVAGTLLLVALVGAVAIASQIHRPRPGRGPSHE